MLDPFTQAQNMQQQKDLASNVKISAPPMFIGSQGPAMPQAEPDSQKLSSILTKPSGPAQSSQDVMGMFTKLGITSSGVPMTDAGKELIIQRLKSKYGDDYKNMPEAQNALSMFDDHLNKYSDMAANDQQAMMSQGAKTLSFLKDWGSGGDV